MRRGFLALGCLITLSSPVGIVGVTQNADVRAIVEQFYPQSLVDLSAEAGTHGDRQNCFAVFDAEPSGAPQTIFAAYTNSFVGAIRVLRPEGGQFHVAAEPQQYQLFGHTCQIELADLDRDGRKEIHLLFTQGTASVHWFFKWDGQSLTSLTPATADPFQGRLLSDLRRADLVDVNNDGVLEVLTVGYWNPFADDPPAPDRLYKLSGGRFVEDQPIVGMWSFERTTGAPVTEDSPIHLPKGARGPFTLEIVNGSANSKDRVTSGWVWLDGQTVAGPADFGAHVSSIVRSVEVGSTARLQVKLAGAPDSKLHIIVRSKAWQ